MVHCLFSAAPSSRGEAGSDGAGKNRCCPCVFLAWYPMDGYGLKKIFERCLGYGADDCHSQARGTAELRGGSCHVRSPQCGDAARGAEYEALRRLRLCLFSHACSGVSGPFLAKAALKTMNSVTKDQRSWLATLGSVRSMNSTASDAFARNCSRVRAGFAVAFSAN